MTENTDDNDVRQANTNALDYSVLAPGLASYAASWTKMWGGLQFDHTFALAFDAAAKYKLSMRHMAHALEAAGVKPFRSDESWPQLAEVWRKRARGLS